MGFKCNFLSFNSSSSQVPKETRIKSWNVALNFPIDRLPRARKEAARKEERKMSLKASKIVKEKLRNLQRIRQTDREHPNECPRDRSPVCTSRERLPPFAAIKRQVRAGRNRLLVRWRRNRTRKYVASCTRPSSSRSSFRARREIRDGARYRTRNYNMRMHARFFPRRSLLPPTRWHRYPFGPPESSIFPRPRTGSCLPARFCLSALRDLFACLLGEVELLTPSLAFVTEI